MADSPPTADTQVTILASSGEDTDSAYGEDAQSLTTSLSSSIWNYNYDNGRRYSAFSKGTYWYSLSRFSPSNTARKVVRSLTLLFLPNTQGSQRRAHG
jgi:hypothetical protein